MTSSAVDSQDLEQVRRRVFLALFVALAVALHTVEVLLPNPLPWFRIGLANILALAALFSYGIQALWIVSISRILIGSLLLGSLFSPGFLLSLGGGLFANSIMSLSYKLWQGRIGPIGVSVLGALGHVTGQLLVAWLVVIRHPSIWMLLPFFLLFALISGIINGLAADYLLTSLYKHPAFFKLKASQAEAEEHT
ncbi:Gx transporter family protein [uncultured Desulfuromusa sp.]|uniref:Gx transporter family protein n=1 Tax=uncultured Desulfuromusa sp. TaxID=219183 RepID=UPI002AA7A498|nr:Gx transporter family protein [uncultured Desulfuromusa sp.]